MLVVERGYREVSNALQRAVRKRDQPGGRLRKRGKTPAPDGYYLQTDDGEGVRAYTGAPNRKLTMDKIRDLRNKEKFVMDDRYLNVYARLCGIHATGVYVSLCRHANKEQTCFPSKRLIAEELKISERKVYDALKMLERWNIIKVSSQGRKKNGSYRSKLYTLLDKSQWSIVPSADTSVGKAEHDPQARGADHHEHDVPNKETHGEGNKDKETHDMSASLEWFNLFWKEYPKKEKKKESCELWLKKKLNPALPAILGFIVKARETDRWRKGYIKNPVAFLSGEGWTDDLTGYDDTNHKHQNNILPAPKGKYENFK